VVCKNRKSNSHGIVIEKLGWKRAKGGWEDNIKMGVR
jgi:hypothetical protein